MKKAAIVKFGDPVLRQKAEEVKVFHKKLHALIDTIRDTLLAGGEGAALAANQVSILKRITVINYMNEYHEMINPAIIESNGELVDYEGCLSLPGYSGDVKRAETVKVRFQNRHGKEITIERSGRMARCIQHEIDHLDGILFIDRIEQKFITNDETGTRVPVNGLIKLSNMNNNPDQP